MTATVLALLQSAASAIVNAPNRHARPLRVYVASSVRNERFEAVVAALRGAGHFVHDFRAEPTFFTWPELVGSDACRASEQRIGLSHPRAQRAFLADMTGLLEADACVLVLPAGSSSHVELGFAVGAGKRTIVLLADGRPELMYAMATSVCTTIEEVVRALATRGVAR